MTNVKNGIVKKEQKNKSNNKQENDSNVCAMQITLTLVKQCDIWPLG